MLQEERNTSIIPMASELHFILFPLMAQGHMIPMVDIAHILAQRGATVTLFTTPLNASRYKSVIARAKEAKLKIHVIEVSFPAAEAGLPEGCENMDMLPSSNLGMNIFFASSLMQKPVELLLQELKPKPSCMISDMYLPWTAQVARKFQIPRIIFNGAGCFFLLCLHNLAKSKILRSITSDIEPFMIPGLPDRIEINKAKVSSTVDPDDDALKEYYDKMRAAEKEAFGVLVNSFQDLEPNYARELAKAKGEKKVWCIGPVSLCNKSNLEKVERGDKAVIDENCCLKWLDSWEPKTVVYVCMGSFVRTSAIQMIDIGLALESSNRPFIWCIRHEPDELKRWFSEENFEERVKERGLVIHGWAPQVLILSHQAIGGFLTHCGWNSILEAVCAGLPMLTWPHFADQFFNESFVVEVLNIGVRIGVEVPVFIGYEEVIGKLVTKDVIMMALERLMDDGVEGKERRNRAGKLGEMAKRAMEEEGSSHVGITKLIQDITERASKREPILE